MPFFSSFPAMNLNVFLIIVFCHQHINHLTAFPGKIIRQYAFVDAFFDCPPDGFLAPLVPSDFFDKHTVLPKRLALRKDRVVHIRIDVDHLKPKLQVSG